MLAFTSVLRRHPGVLQVNQSTGSLIPSNIISVEVPTAAEPTSIEQGFDGHVTRAKCFREGQFPFAIPYDSRYDAESFFRPHTDGTLLLMNIGERIRNCRRQKGLSQGDLEQRTGLLRCYLSRVENGHTTPSIGTLAKIAGAMAVPLAQLFSDRGPGGNGSRSLSRLSENEVRFLRQIQRDATNLNESDRKLVLAMVKKMAAKAAR
jgi:transcriptional regulator with XRE-family HTH domain